jgi:hypothetical protein
MNFGMWILKNSHCFHCRLVSYSNLNFFQDVSKNWGIDIP